MGLNEAQLAMAGQVLTGRVDCEFKQTVMIEPNATQAGHFRVKYNSTIYNMVPEETTTGAVRLVDNKAGVVWLQIPVKSMMMNSKAGRRMVDACAHPTQVAALALAEAEARVAQAAEAAAAASAATAPVVPPALGTSRAPAQPAPTQAAHPCCAEHRGIGAERAKTRAPTRKPRGYALGSMYN